MQKVDKMNPEEWTGLTENLKKYKYHIPFGYGKPKREKVISKEDIIDLVIALNSCKDLNELCETI